MDHTSLILARYIYSPHTRQKNQSWTQFVDEAGMKNLKSMQYLENIETDFEDQPREKSMNDETKKIKNQKWRRNGLKNSSILVVLLQWSN